MVAQRQELVTVQDYLLLDQQSAEKLAYYLGTVVAQAGSTARHNLISANVIGHLYAPIRQHGCHLFPSDMRVQAAAQQVYTYPNVTIVCGTPTYAEPNEMTLLNPTVIIEILSPSTQTYDQQGKLEYYRTIDSLQAYIVIAQDRPNVQYYVRQTPTLWLLRFVDDIAATIELSSIQVTIALVDIYSGIAFSESR